MTLKTKLNAVAMLVVFSLAAMNNAAAQDTKSASKPIMQKAHIEKRAVKRLTFVKQVDKSTPLLFSRQTKKGGVPLPRGYSVSAGGDEEPITLGDKTK